MNTLEKLLNADLKKFNPKVKTYKMFVSRLGEELEFTVRELSTEKYQTLSESAVRVDSSGNMQTDLYKLRVNLIYNSCKDIFCNQSLLSKFKCAEPQELVSKILTGREIEELSNEVAKLSESAEKEMEKESEEINF